MVKHVWNSVKKAVLDSDIDSIKQLGTISEITLSSVDRTTPISSVTPATAAQDVLSWNDLGLNSADYSTKYAVTIVPSTMAVTVTAK